MKSTLIEHLMKFADHFLFTFAIKRLYNSIRQERGNGGVPLSHIHHTHNTRFY